MPPTEEQLRQSIANRESKLAEVKRIDINNDHKFSATEMADAMVASFEKQYEADENAQKNSGISLENLKQDILDSRSSDHATRVGAAANLELDGTKFSVGPASLKSDLTNASSALALDMGSLSTIANAEQAERTDVQARTAERARVFTSNPLYATNAGFKAAADAIIAMPESDIMAARDRAAATLGANIDHSTLSLEAQRAAGTIENLQALQHAENTQAPSPAITKALLSEVISLGQQLAHYNPLDVETPSQQQIADAIDRRLAAKGNAPSK